MDLHLVDDKLINQFLSGAWEMEHCCSNFLFIFIVLWRRASITTNDPMFWIGFQNVVQSWVVIAKKMTSAVFLEVEIQLLVFIANLGDGLMLAVGGLS